MSADVKLLYKFKKLLTNCRLNFPDVKIDIDLNLVDGSLVAFIDNKEFGVVVDFPNVKNSLLWFNWLYSCRFSTGSLSYILETKKKGRKRNKDRFFYLLRKSIKWDKIKRRALAELWEEYEGGPQYTPPEERGKEQDTAECP